MVSRSRLLPGLLALGLAACGASETKPLTSIVVVCDSDVAAVDHVRFELEQSGKKAKRVSAALKDEQLYLTLVHESGALGPLHVTVVGLDGTRELLRREALVHFVADKTLTLPLFLSAACVGKSCPANETCTEDGCSPKELVTLSPWNGTPPKLGGGASVGGDGGGGNNGGADGGQSGNDGGAQSNADGSMPADASVTCSANTDTDPDNCGACGVKCGNRHAATRSCVSGQCSYHCDTGWENCNQDTTPLDGCETKIGTAAECGCGDGC